MQILKLARVTSVDLSIEDHGILTLGIGLDYGGSGQCFGGYCLDTWDKEKNRRVGHAAGTDYILKTLNLFKVNRLEEIKGRTVFAIMENDTFSSKIIGLKMPDFDGGKEFLISEWQDEWFEKLDY